MKRSGQYADPRNTGRQLPFVSTICFRYRSAHPRALGVRALTPFLSHQVGSPSRNFINLNLPPGNCKNFFTGTGVHDPGAAMLADAGV